MDRSDAFGCACWSRALVRSNSWIKFSHPEWPQGPKNQNNILLRLAGFKNVQNQLSFLLSSQKISCKAAFWPFKSLSNPLHGVPLAKYWHCTTTSKKLRMVSRVARGKAFHSTFCVFGLDFTEIWPAIAGAWQHTIKPLKRGDWETCCKSYSPTSVHEREEHTIQGSIAPHHVPLRCCTRFRSIPQLPRNAL